MASPVDQEMKDAPPVEDGATEQAAPAPAKPEDPNVQLLADLKFIVGLLEKTANSKEVRHISRVLRKTTTFR